MKIYTRGGDGGETGLFGGARLPKSAPRIAAYGEVDELNAVLGWCAVVCPETLAPKLRREQERLFALGSHLATDPRAGAQTRSSLPAWEEGAVSELEREIDSWESGLPPLKNFILPGGGETAARLHLARTACRRAERQVVALAALESVAPLHLAYLNRLSDWLFVLARESNRLAGVADRLWKPRSTD